MNIPKEIQEDFKDWIRLRRTADSNFLEDLDVYSLRSVEASVLSGDNLDQVAARKKLAELLAAAKKERTALGTFLREVQENAEHAAKDPFSVSSLSQLPESLKAFCAASKSKGWVDMGQGDKLNAWTIYGASYHEARQKTKYDDYRPEYATVMLAQYDIFDGQMHTTAVSVYSLKCNPETGSEKISDLLARHDMLPMFASARERYDHYEALLAKLLPRYGKQLLVTGYVSTTDEEDSEEDADRGYRSYRYYHRSSRYLDGTNTSRSIICAVPKAIVQNARDEDEREADSEDDEETTEDFKYMEPHDRLRSLDPSAVRELVQPKAMLNTQKRARNERYGATTSSFVESYTVPVNHQFRAYCLSLNEFISVHPSQIRGVKYDQHIADKLILSESVKDLIVFLTASNKIEDSTDVIGSKGGGTLITLMGPPGVGKTLSAEVVAEHLRQPLYKVSAATLGTSGDGIESNLTLHLARAERWEAVMLLDEADVFIQKRGSDLQLNAIVSAMLRKLEYFKGVLFLTTNRLDDVDDAILSRCSAVFTFELPKEDEAQQLWTQYSEMFGVNLSKAEVSQLSKDYNTLSGRTIHHTMRMAARLLNRDPNRDKLELVKFVVQFVPHAHEK